MNGCGGAAGGGGGADDISELCVCGMECQWVVGWAEGAGCGLVKLYNKWMCGMFACCRSTLQRLLVGLWRWQLTRAVLDPQSRNGFG